MDGNTMSAFMGKFREFWCGSYRVEKFPYKKKNHFDVLSQRTFHTKKKRPWTQRTFQSKFNIRCFLCPCEETPVAVDCKGSHKRRVDDKCAICSEKRCVIGKRKQWWPVIKKCLESCHKFSSRLASTLMGVSENNKNSTPPEYSVQVI